MQKIKSIRYNFIMNFLLTATNFIFPLITFPYVSRVLQSTGMGTVSFATSVANYFIMIASLGIPTYGIRACAKVRDNKEELTKVTHEIFTINTVTTALSLLFFLLSVWLVPQFREEKVLFYINGINILLNLFGMHWLYQALEQYDYITVRSVAAKIISVILMITLVHKESDYVIYGAIGVFAAAGMNVLNLIRARKYILFRRQSDYNFSRHFKPILTLSAQSMIVSLYTNLDTVMLGFLKPNSEVGLYNAAIKVKMILVSLVSSFSSVLLPRMSNIVKHGDKEQFNALTRMALDVTSLMAIPLSVYFCLYAKESILFLAGTGFLGAILPMQFITIAIIPNGLTGVLGVQVMTSLEKEKYVLNSVIVGAVADFILNLLFIPKYGAAGAAFATMCAELLVLVVQLYYTRDIVKPMIKQLRALYYVAATVAGSFVSIMVMCFITSTNSFIRLFTSAIVFFGIYLLVLLMLKEPMLIQYLGEIKNLLLKKRGKDSEKV